MKTLATIFFILFIGVTAQAQNNTKEANAIETTPAVELNIESTTKIARLYKNKNYKVIKALAFTTKKNKAKMA